MSQCITAGNWYFVGHRDSIIRAHGGQLWRRTRTTDKTGIEGGQVLPDARSVVSLGIHGDVDDLQFIGRCSQLLACLRQDAESYGTHFGAGSIAERQQNHFTAVAAEL